MAGVDWRKIQARSVSILDIGSVYFELQECFEKWGMNAQEIKGQPHLRLLVVCTPTKFGKN